MILLDNIEPEADGELIAGRRINRYQGRGSSFRKPMAEIEVGDILWDELRSEHWIVQEVSYAEADEDDPRGASLYIRDAPRGRMFYEKEKYYGSILVLSNPSALLRYRTEALNREHKLLLESEKPRSAFPIFSDSLKAGDTFFHPTRGWLTVKALIRGGNFELTDGTEVSLEEIGRETQVLRRADRPDMRDALISDEDFDALLDSKSRERTKRKVEQNPQSQLQSRAKTSTRVLSQNGRPITLNSVPGRAVKVFIDELENGDTVFWPGSGWQSVIGIMASPGATREVKVVTLSNRDRVTPNLETMVLEIFIPDGEAPEVASNPVFGWKTPHAVKAGERVLTEDGWQKAQGHSGGAVDYDGKQWRCYGEDALRHTVREFRDHNSNPLVYTLVSPKEAELNPQIHSGAVYSWQPLNGTNVVPGEEAKAPTGRWLPLHSVARVEGRRMPLGRIQLTGFEGAFRYPDGSFAHGPLTTFEDSQGKLSYIVRRQLSESDIENLQKGYDG